MHKDLRKGLGNLSLVLLVFGICVYVRQVPAVSDADLPWHGGT